MFNIISHWGNTNQNNETPLCMAINKNIKPKQKITVNKEMETLCSLCIIGGNVKRGLPWETVFQFSKS